MSKRVYGIDLGTTYSCISYVDEHGKPVVVSNAENETTTPSVVWFESPDNIVVGSAAKEMTVIHKDRVVSTIKRHMGERDYTVLVDGKSYTPQEISSYILRKLVKDAATNTGDTIEDVVITCPAYFGPVQKNATREGGVLAGLNVLYVIPEPTAAALAYGFTPSDEQTILVYDLGGGTFDISLIAVSRAGQTVVTTGGNDQLGGKDWDAMIVEYLAGAFEAETGTRAQELLDDVETYQELLNDSERIKIRLSAAQSVTQRVRYQADSAKVELSREKFDEITLPLLERTVSFTEQMLERAKELRIEKIDQLLLVGGSTYMPQVIERMKRFPFGVKQFDPNQAVAKGAALFGYKAALEDAIKMVVAEQVGESADTIDMTTVSTEVKEAAQREVATAHGLALPGLKQIVERSITNVSSKSFGLVTVEDDVSRREYVTNIVVADDPVPRDVSQPFHTLDEGQVDIELRVMENQIRTAAGGRVELAECQPEPLGTALLTFARPLPKNSPIEVTFRLAPDGCLTVHARDLTTGGEIEAAFETGSTMSKDQLTQTRNRALAMTVT
jgi:molecular chaperone DnaK (HSP70)